MNPRVVIGLALCAICCTAGILLNGTTGALSSLSTLLTALGLAAGTAMGTASLAGALRRAVRVGRAPLTSDTSRTIDLLARLADEARRGGALVLADAPADIAWGLLRHGCGRVVRADDPAAIRADLTARAEAAFTRIARRRAIIAGACLGAGVIAMLTAFAILAEFGAATVDPSRVVSGSGLGVLLCVLSAFSMVILAPAAAEYLAAADARDALVASLVIEGVLGLRAGNTGKGIRTLLEREAAVGPVTTAPSLVPASLAA